MTIEEAREIAYNMIECMIDYYALTTTKVITRLTKNNESVKDEVILLRAYTDLHAYFEQHKSDFINNFRKLGK